MATVKEPKQKKGTKKFEKTLVLLDAHAILHRAYHALPDFTSPKGEPTGALYGVVAMLLKIIEDIHPDYIVACFDLPDPTYRHEVYKEYKAGRKKTDDALVAQINRSRDIFEAFNIPIYEKSGFEADDMLGTIVSETKDQKALRVVIASGDMDTLQLVSKDRVVVYTLKKGINDTVLYNEGAVLGRFGFLPTLVPDYKGLRGDPSDNIPGIKGIGEKTATTLITNFGTIERMYATLKKGDAAFKNAGIKERIIELIRVNEEEALFSKMLATIRKDAPINFVLPKEEWLPSVQSEKVLTLFGEFGFRTLTTRVQTLFNIAPAPQTVSIEDTEHVERLAIALWLLHSDTTNPTAEDVLQYGRTNECETLDQIEAHMMERLTKEGLMPLYNDVELPLRSVLRDMEKIGILIDKAHLKKLSKTMHRELTILEEKIYAASGVTFNINSPKQLGEVLYDTLGLKPKYQKHTATGQRSTRESELEKLIDMHPIIEHILRYREVQKLVGTYIDTLPELVKEDGRLHTTFLQAGSVTGRMATQNPGVQNIPVRTEEGRLIRRAFMSEEGYSLVSIDYSQVELRVAAMLSGDRKLVQVFRDGEDVHEGVASRVFQVPLNEVTPEMRRQAKVINFGILYGMGVNALRANLGEGTTREAAQEFLNAYFNTFTRLAEYLEETKAFARAHGYTTTYFGRRRHFPGIQSSAPFIRAQAERMAINAPVQGTSADIIRIAMVTIHAYLTETKQTDTVRLILQVHDELVFEIKNSVLDKVIGELKTRMEQVIDTEKSLGVPFLTQIKVGNNWDQMTPYKEKK